MTDHIKTVTLTPAEQVDHAVTQAMDRAIPRLQKLHAHAGRPAWDQVLREEVSAAIRAMPLPPEPAVRVKPLVWECTDWSAADGVKGENDCVWEADHRGMNYMIEWLGGGVFLVTTPEDTDFRVTSLASAKAAAQADYEARIMAALDVSPEPDQWQPIETAPKDTDILVWFDHEADLYHDPNDPQRLTDYAGNAEGNKFLDGRGVTVARWQKRVWESVDEYGGGYWLPAGWFSRGDFGHYEVVCNATHWMPLPAAPSSVSYADLKGEKHE